MKYEIWKQCTISGCVYEDGADTREGTDHFFVVAEKDKDDFGEFMAEEYGSQDYSHKVDFFKLMTLHDIDELKQIKKAIEIELERPNEVTQ